AASCREQARSSVSSATVTGGEVMTGAHQVLPTGWPAGPVVKWVCSRSRPAARELVAGDRDPAAGCASSAPGSRTAAAAGGGPAQREPGIQGGPQLGVCRAGGGEVIGQDKVIQIAGHRGDEAVELGDDRASGRQGQVAAGPGGRGDLRAGRAQEVTKDGGHG